MDIAELIGIVNLHHRDEGRIDFPRIVYDLPEKMSEQSSDIPGIETEWVWQITDQFDCYCGELAYKLDDGQFLIFEFSG